MRKFFVVIATLLCALPSLGQYTPGGQFTGVYQVNQFHGGTLDGKIQACVNMMSATSGGICDARSFGAATLAGTITISTANVRLYLPCATITTAYPVIVAAGVRNTSIMGCTFQGGSTASGTAGGTVWIYTGSGAAFQIGDTTYAANTPGFHLDNINLNTATAGSAAMGFAFYRTQEIDLRNVYLNGNNLTGQTAIYLDGTGNYTGGTFDSNTMNGFGTGLYLTGHLSGSVVGDFTNASTFIRQHIVCPTSGGNPITGTYGINVLAADGNTWTGGDVEGCSTMFRLGANAVNNTIVGLRNENSTIQYQADSGSGFNYVATGGTLFTGDLIDNGSRNSFWDAFHHTVNGMNGDWYASQQDATVVNHLRLGIGAGTVRGLQWESQVDVGTSSSQYNWLWGLTDGVGGSSNWIYQDLLNNTIRLQLGQLNTSGGNNGSALNGAGTGNVCFNCSSNSGTGGVAFGSGGATPSTVGTIDSSGNASLNGYLRFLVSGSGTWLFNCASASACTFDNAASGNAHHIRLYNGSGTEIDSEGTSAVTVNNASTGGTGGFIDYLGGADSGVIAFSVSGYNGSNANVTATVGSASGFGNLVVGNHLNQIATADFAGHCTMTTTTCTVSFQHSWTSTPSCTATPQGTTPYYAAVSVSSNVATITANASNTAVWSVHCVGDPN